MFDLVTLIKTVGYLGLFAIVLAESGLFIGFFLPGDSLLFTAGFLASQEFFDIKILVAGFFVSAVIGDSIGYTFGRRVGPAIFKKEDSLLFHKNHLERARIFYEKFGGRAIILARFMPVIRTFAPILAGVGHMRYAAFVFYNVIGGALWTLGLTLLGFFLGRSVPHIDRYLLPIILLIIILSILPSAVHILRDPHHRAEIINFARRKLMKKRYEKEAAKKLTEMDSTGEGAPTQGGG